jgi:hypothetical protein
VPRGQRDIYIYIADHRDTSLYTTALQLMKLHIHTNIYFRSYIDLPKATRGLEPISYRGVLVSTLLHATVTMFLHNLLNVLVQIADRIKFKKIYIDLSVHAYGASY